MKKSVIAAFLVFTASTIYADFQVGIINAYGNCTFYDAAGQSSSQVQILMWGLESRARIGIAQFSATAVYVPPLSNLAGELIARTDLGVSADVGAFRFGVGAGPDFRFDVGSGTPSLMALWNAKLSADLTIDRMSIGIISFFDAPPQTTSFMLTLMYKLF